MKRLLLIFSSVFRIFNPSFSQTPTWSEDIAPILYANCTKCHHPGGPGHFSLLTFMDAYTYGSQMEVATANRIMPPWTPDENYKHFARERVLSQGDIDKISLWVAGGKLQGDATLAPTQPVYTNTSTLGTVDLSVRIPTYTVGDNTDIYRNFPISTTVPAGTYITAVEVIPGNTHIVHHVIIFHDSTSTPTTLDNNDPGPGYTNFGGTGSLASKMMAGYTPGSTPYYTPEGTGFRLAANTKIIVQVHYPAGSLGLVDSTRVNFKLTTIPQREITVWPVLNYLQNISSTINIPAGTTRTYTEQQALPATDYTYLSTFPHMHLIGTTIKSWANKPGTNDTIPFISIPGWDFKWQDMYVFPNAIRVPGNSTIRAIATYDNTVNNPNHLQQTVVAGNGTTDEMMIVFFAYMPYQSGDENLIIDRRIVPQGATTFCSGQSVVLKMIEGTGYTYQWYRNGAVINGATSFSYAATQAGNYHALISLGPNNSLTDTIAVNVVSSPTAIITPSGATTICPGNSVTLNASTGSGYSYQWFNNTTPVTNATSSSFNTSVAGNYTVQVYNGCYANSNTVNVATASAPSNTVTPSGATTFCQGGSVTLSAPAGLTYNWSNGATSQNINVNQSGSFTVTVTNGNNCSAVSSATVVTVNSLPSAALTPNGATTFCQGGSVTLSASAGLNYNWSNGATSQTINVNQSGSYSVTVTNGNNCSAVSTSTTVTVNSLPASSVTPSGATTFCQGGSVTLSAPAGLTYHWNTNASTQTINVNQSGSYLVTVTNGNNCSAVSSAVTITVNSLPGASVTPSGATTFCQGGSVTLSAPAGLTYNWSNSTTSQSVNVTQSGSYVVTVTNANNCSAVSSSTTITVNALPMATITPNGATSFCPGGSVTLTASPNTSYLWSNNITTQSITVNQSGNYLVTVTNANNCSNTASTNVTVYPTPDASVTTNQPTTICPGDSVTLSAPVGMSYAWNNNATIRSITVSANGSFTVTVTDNNSCTAISTPITVTVSNNAVAGITPSSATTFCEGGSVELTASNGTAYLWSNNATSSSITVNASGTFTVTVTVSGSCTAVSAPVNIIVNQNPSTPTITASGSTSICEGSSVDLSAPSGYSYQWSSGETTSDVTITQSGSYTVTITDLNSCSAVSNATAITVNPLPTVTLSGNAASLCSTASPVTLSEGAPSGGTFSGTGVSGNLFNPSVAGVGNHHITYSYDDNNGCSNSASETIVVTVCSGITELNDWSFAITPNPSDGNFIVESKGMKVGAVLLKIFDVSGKLVYASVLEKIKTEISLGEIPSGCYLLQLKTEMGILHRKLMVQK